jgi:predicted ribosome quality control (RQC) complex YloA/Tae2 family protein
MKFFRYNYSEKKLLDDENDDDENDDDIIIPIKIGQNANENKDLIDEAGKSDLWFHIDDLPSPHGIIYISQSNVKNVNDIVKDKHLINIVANLVRDNSKYKNHKLKIIYCPINNLSHGDKIGSVFLKSSPKSIKI